jgi:hypothetical protein
MSVIKDQKNIMRMVWLERFYFLIYWNHAKYLGSIQQPP